MAKYNNRLQPHREENTGYSKRKGFDAKIALAQNKRNRHFLIGLLCAMFGNKLIAVIYLYHQYKLHLLLNGKNEEKAGKERSYYIRLYILKELSIISMCFRLLIFVVFCVGLFNAFQRLGMM